MKKWKSLFIGVLIGIIIMLLVFIGFFYHKNKYNLEQLSVEEAIESIRSSTPKNKQFFSQDAIYITAKYIEKLGDAADRENFPLLFFQPKLTGNFYQHKIKLKDSLLVTVSDTDIYDITDKKHYTPITDLIPINIDSLAQKTIYLKNKYLLKNGEISTKKIVLKVTKNKIVKVNYLSGEQHTGVCIPIYINKKPTMVFFVFNNMNGYLMKTNEGWEGKIGEIDFTTTGFEEHTIQSVVDLEAFEKLKKQENKPFYYKEYDFTIKKGEIYSNRLPKPLLNNPMDTLYTIGEQYNKQLIVGEKKHKKYLFNGLLQDITPKGFKAIHYANETFTALVNNQVFDINDTGKLSQIKPKKETKAYNTYHYVYEIKESNHNSFYITCKGYDTTNLLESYKTTPINNIEEASLVTFTNHTKKIKILAEHLEQKQNYIVTKKDGLFGLYKFSNIIKDYDFEESIAEITVNINLTPLLPNQYEQIIANEMTSLVLFEKDGLKGYYPLHKNGKYQTLSPFLNNAFAKFTLPDGRKGWLQYNGKEYFY